MSPAPSTLIKFGIAAALLYLVFAFVPVREVAAALGQAAPAPIAAAFGVLLLERLAAGARTKILSDRVELKLSLYRICEIGIVSSFYGMFIPGELGGAAARWYKLSQPTGRRAQAVAVIAYDRLIDTLGLCGLGLALWLVDLPRVTPWAIGAVFAASFAALLAGIAASLHPAAGALALRLLSLEAWPRPLALVCDKLRKVLESARAMSGLSAGAMLALVALTIARHLLAIWITYLFALSVGLSVPFLVLGWVHCLVTIAAMIPISIAGLGVRQASFVLLLAPYGVAGSAAVAISFLELFMHVAIAAGGGLLELKNQFRAGGEGPVARPAAGDG